jgi:hypothetical protein
MKPSATAPQDFQGILSKGAKEHLALDAVPQHRFANAQFAQGYPYRPKTPIGSLTELVAVCIRMLNYP